MNIDKPDYTKKPVSMRKTHLYVIEVVSDGALPDSDLDDILERAREIAAAAIVEVAEVDQSFEDACTILHRREVYAP